MPSAASHSKRFWLMKSEPGVYSIEDLGRDGSTPWNGVRNYQARNFMRDEMRVGDLVLFYHSNAQPPGVAGVGRICRAAYPDVSATDASSPYYDARSSAENPRWWMVDVEFVEQYPRVVSLEVMRADPALSGMLVFKRGMRLSVQPVAPEHFRRVSVLGKEG